MVAFALRSRNSVPDGWWVQPVAPEPEPPGKLVRRLRDERVWTREHVCRQIYGKDTDDKAIRACGASLQRYEDASSQVSPRIIDGLERLFGLESRRLVLMGHDWELWKLNQEPLPGPGVAIGPAAPILLQTLERLVGLDERRWKAVSQFVERVAEEKPGAEEELAG